MKSAQAASVAFSPRTARQGSPGTIRDRKKTRKTSPNSTGIVTSSRRMMNWVKRGALQRWPVGQAAPGPASDDERTGRRVRDAPFELLIATPGLTTPGAG